MDTGEIFLLKFKTSEALIPVSLLKEVGFNRERFTFFVVPEDSTVEFFEQQIELNKIDYIKLLYKNVYYMPPSIIAMLIKDGENVKLKGLSLAKRATHYDVNNQLEDFISFVRVLVSSQQLNIKLYDTSVGQRDALDVGHSEHMLIFTVIKQDLFPSSLVTIILNTLKNFFDVQYSSMDMLDFNFHNVSYIVKYKKYYDCDFLNLLILEKFYLEVDQYLEYVDKLKLNKLVLALTNTRQVVSETIIQLKKDILGI